MTTPACPQGHPVAPGSRFCPICGAAVPAAPPAAGTALPARGLSAWVPAIVGAVALAAAVVFAVVTLGGDDGPTTTGAATVTEPATTPTDPGGTSPATEPPDTTPGETVPPSAAGTWTVLVYMIGDNDLEENALGDLEEMAQVPGGDGFDVVVLADRAGPEVMGEVSGGVVGLDDWTDVKLLQIEGGEAIVLDEPGELDMGDPATLAGFLADGIARFPADHYALVLWDHGATVFGMGPDLAGGEVSLLDTRELRDTVRGVLDQAGIDRLDLIGFDACLMGSLETAVMMEPVARYLLASEEIEPGVGWDWTALAYLASADQPTAEGLGREIIDRYHAHPVLAAVPQHTLSLVDLDLIGDVNAAVSALGADLTADIGTYAPVLGQQRGKTLEFGRDIDEWNSAYMVDLGHLANRLSKRSPELEGPAEVLKAAIDAAVVYEAHGPSAKTATGLAVHFPGFPEYWDRVQPYYDLLEGNAWRPILDAYFAAGRGIPVDRRPSFAAIGSAATAEFVDPSGLHVSADFTGALSGDIASVRLLFGMQTSAGRITWMSDYPGDVTGTTATVVHGLEVILLDDREAGTPVDDQAVPAFHRITREETDTGSITTIEVPVAYFPPGVAPGGPDYLSARLLEHNIYDAATDEWSFGRELVVTTEAGTVGSIIPDPDGVIYPLVLEEQDDARNWVLVDRRPLSADLDRLSMIIWTAGFPGNELHLELTVADYGGNTASAGTVAVVPEWWQTGVG